MIDIAACEEGMEASHWKVVVRRSEEVEFGGRSVQEVNGRRVASWFATRTRMV